MNKLKANSRILLIIIVSVFVIIPTVSILLTKTIGIHEGMTEKNVKMERININGIDFEKNDNSKHTGVSGEYLYCIGGDITCSNGGNLVNDVCGNTYTDYNGDTHNSYMYSCGETDSFAICNNYISKKDNNSVSLFDSDNKEELLLEGPTNDEFKGFLGPYKYVPMDISDNYVYLYNNQGIIDMSGSACYLYGDCPTTDNKVDEKADTTASNKTIKCLADNGAKPGDPLCCGQDGVLQNTKYNCPSEYPYCIGYKCGESWGKCSTTSEK